MEVLNKDIKEASIILTDLQVSLLWIGDSTDTDTDNTDNVSLQYAAFLFRLQIFL